MTKLDKQYLFFTHLNPFGNDPGEEKPHEDYTVPQKVRYKTNWKHNQDAVYWIKNFPERRIKGAGSRIAFMANKIICKHHLRHSARRMY